MTHVPVIRRRNGPITRAIADLDERTRGLQVVPGPGVRVSNYPSGTTISVTNNQPSTRRAFTGTPVWG
jgi:hypothetical protein